MDCQKCQELLSDYLDGALEQKEQVVLNRHLQECSSCAEVRDDLREIVGFCHEYRHEYDAVPNQHALWLRISNVVEGERERLAWANRAAENSATGGERGGWWSDFMNRRWTLSMPQLAAALAAIMIAVSAGTIAGLRITEPRPEAPPVVAAAGASDVPAARDYLNVMRRQQTNIDHFNQLVEQRKSRWSPQMREAFDRNMHEIDLSVDDALSGLRQNPHDGVAEEMLDAAISEKMELLKEFSEF